MTAEKDNNNETAAANAAIEKQVKDYKAKAAKAGQDTPESKVQKLLGRGAKAVETMLANIKEVEGYEKLVNFDKLEGIKILKHSNIKDAEDNRMEIARAIYTGNDLSILQWQNEQLRAESKPSKKAGKSSPYNVAADSVVKISNAIMAAAKSGSMEVGKLVSKAFASLNEADYKGLHKDGTADAVKKKVKDTVGKLSGNTATGFDGLDEKGMKLKNDGGKYKVVAAV